MVTLRCKICGKSFDASLARAKYCSSTCRSRAHRGVPALSQFRAPFSATDDEDDLVAAVIAELEAAGRRSSALGVAAIILAREMCGPVFSGAAFAALSKELRATMALALRDVPAAPDLLDELRARRDAKRLVAPAASPAG